MLGVFSQFVFRSLLISFLVLKKLLFQTPWLLHGVHLIIGVNNYHPEQCFDAGLSKADARAFQQEAVFLFRGRFPTLAGMGNSTALSRSENSTRVPIRVFWSRKAS